MSDNKLAIYRVKSNVVELFLSIEINDETIWAMQNQITEVFRRQIRVRAENG